MYVIHLIDNTVCIGNVNTNDYTLADKFDIFKVSDMQTLLCKVHIYSFILKAI